MSAPSKETGHELPEIISFKTSDKLVEKRESFSLFWDVKNAETIEIFKNDVLFLKRHANEKSVVIQETYDGKDKEIRYTLVALNDFGQTHSLPVSVKVTDLKSRHTPSPEIVYFETSTSIVQNKESFTLNWDVENASHVDLYRNGLVLKKYSGGKANAVLHESYDGRDKDIIYTLVVSNNKEKIESAPVTISVKEKISPVSTNQNETFEEDTHAATERAETTSNEFSVGDNDAIPPLVNDMPEDEVVMRGRNQVPFADEETPLIQDRYQQKKQKNIRNIRLALWGISLVMVVILFGVFYYFQSKPRILDFDPKSNKEEHSIVIVGKNFPSDSNKFQILFNKIKGSVQYNSKEIIRVLIPILNQQTHNDSANFEVEIMMVYKGDTLRAPKKLLVTPTIVSQRNENNVNAVTDNVPLVDSPRIEIPQKIIKVKEKPKDIVVEKIPAKVDSQLVEKKEEPKKHVDIDILKMVSVGTSEGSKRFLGGIKGLKVTVVNDSPYDLDNVNIAITYWKNSVKEVKKEQMVFANVRAHSRMTLDGPRTNRGSTATASISSVSSKQLDADLKH